MAFDSFLDATRFWFSAHLGDPTPTQLAGWSAIRKGEDTLIAAPTGSGKTLAAFLHAIDGLFAEGVDKGTLPDEVRVVYISPLKALSADINKNLSDPLLGIRKAAEQAGIGFPEIRSAVRSGDTSSSARSGMLRRPPQILVTTPESLYLLLTAERSREMLRTVTTVIVDEIHAVIGSRRGAHLALSLERLSHVAVAPLQKIGLSATQRPIERVARYLTGVKTASLASEDSCTIIDDGHLRNLDLDLELPSSPLESVMSHEVWEEVYGRLANLVEDHGTTLVFVNTRRLAERLTRHLAERLGGEYVATHHGSLSKDHRLRAETRLKSGRLKALVATASLELGIDIGYVDLVCQIGSPRWISTFLQRVGRSGHTVFGRPKGRLFPLTREDLVECAALLRATRAGELDELLFLDEPLDVLAQQIVAEVATEEWDEISLFQRFSRSYPYRNLSSETFRRVIEIVSRGYATSRGRRGALIHYDGVNTRLRARRVARLTALTSGGAIPDNADYRVVLDPGDTFIGTVNEDFAVESSAGDVFQLGNASWRIEKIESGTVRVSDAAGEPPTIPFWFGEAPGRSDVLSDSLSRLIKDLEALLSKGDEELPELRRLVLLPDEAWAQIVHYLKSARHLLGVLPTKDTLVLERFFDESGGMQLVLHTPFGMRINRAWGLALRKKFCRRFNFELQSAATDNAILLSLGPQHSFPLDDVFRYLNSSSVRDVLVQAVLDAPVFQTRWRWNSTISLAIPRNRAGRKVPPPLQRMQAEDLLAAVFPDAGACLENIAGDREVPDHPLVHQAIEDCLNEAMDLNGLIAVLKRIESGEIDCVSRDTPEPSVLSHEILSANPYAFLDPAPLEERRTQAVYRRRTFEPTAASELGLLDEEAITEVRRQAWPLVRDADELHDALLTGGFLMDQEVSDSGWREYVETLVRDGRAVHFEIDSGQKRNRLWLASERARRFDLDDSTATTEFIRNRMEILGPTTSAAMARQLGIATSVIDQSLLALENEGSILRGYFSCEDTDLQWCNRRLLARIHQLTINRLRAEIQPVSPAEFMHFLFSWQRVATGDQAEGIEGLRAVVDQLDGYELPASAWETEVLSSRVRDYDPAMLDALCLTGRIWWGKLSLVRPNGEGSARPIRTTPVALALPEHVVFWKSFAGRNQEPALSTYGRKVLATLETHGAIFFRDIVRESQLIASHVEIALAELVSAGVVSSDGFTGLRVLLTPSEKRRPLASTARRRVRTVPFGMESAGRWFVVSSEPSNSGASSDERLTALEAQARALLRRYGIVFRRLLFRETNLAPWWELTKTFRALEARGEIRGGRFVSGMSGEQYALPEAVGMVRRLRRSPSAELVVISAADPLNLTGIISHGDRVSRIASNRIAYRSGIPIASLEAGVIRSHSDKPLSNATRSALKRGWVSPALRAYWGERKRARRPEPETN